MTKERMGEMNKLKNIINSLDDSADADDFHKFVDTCQINYEEGVFNEILRFMQSQAERVKELEEENIQLNNEMEGLLQKIEDKEPYYSMKCLKLEQQNKRYREALEFYTNEVNHDFEINTSITDIEVKYETLEDYGSKARQVLRGE